MSGARGSAPGKPKPPRAPKRLGVSGRALWRQMHATYTFDAWELEVLAHACRQADAVTLLEEYIGEQGVTVTGSNGQERLNAAITEARQARIALARLLGELKLPNEGDAQQAPGSQQGQQARNGRSRRAQRAAEYRWRNVRRLRGDDGTA